MWRIEILLAAVAGIDMAHHDKEAGMLQVEVGIHIHQRIVAHFCLALSFLHGKLSQTRGVIGGIVLGEIAGVRSQVTLQHLGYLELKIEVGIDVDSGHGQCVGIGRFLVGDDIFPVESFTGNLSLEFGDYSFEEPRYSIKGCKERSCRCKT